MYFKLSFISRNVNYLDGGLLWKDCFLSIKYTGKAILKVNLKYNVFKVVGRYV